MNNINITNFDIDLKKGENAEQMILQAIQKKYPRASKMQGNFKPYDIFIPETDTKVEVKADEKSKETGNFFIECSFNGNPSGIVSTQADYWAIVSDKVYWFTTLKLKELVIDKEPIKRVGADGTTIEGYLTPKPKSPTEYKKMAGRGVIPGTH